MKQWREVQVTVKWVNGKWGEHWVREEFIIFNGGILLSTLSREEEFRDLVWGARFDGIVLRKWWQEMGGIMSSGGGFDFEQEKEQQEWVQKRNWWGLVSWESSCFMASVFYWILQAGSWFGGLNSIGKDLEEFLKFKERRNDRGWLGHMERPFDMTYHGKRFFWPLRFNQFWNIYYFG